MGTGREREKGQPGFLPEEVEQSDCQVEMPTITDSHHPPLSAGPSHHAALVSFLSPCTNITGMKYEQSQHCNAWRWAGRGGMGALCRKPYHHNFASEVALQLGWLTGESAMLPSSLRRWSHAAVGRTACVLRLPLTSRMYVAPSAAVASVTTAPPSAPTQVRSGAVLRLLPHFWHLANSPPPPSPPPTARSPPPGEPAPTFATAKSGPCGRCGWSSWRWRWWNTSPAWSVGHNPAWWRWWLLTPPPPDPSPRLPTSAPHPGRQPEASPSCCRRGGGSGGGRGRGGCSGGGAGAQGGGGPGVCGHPR